MLLHQLFHQFDPQLNLEDTPDVLIQGICDDSRQVKPGDLFIARDGTRTQGLQFVSEAAGRGAVAVVAPMRVPGCRLPQVPLHDTASAVSQLAQIFHGRPARGMRIVAVTGTNGKTTTTYLLRHILGKTNIRCGLIGTVEIDDGRRAHEATMTTPGAVELAGLLANMRKNGCRACAMETSSHALHQSRVNGISFAGAAFTNLTGDHLDYHGDMEHYADAKARLFEMIGEESVAVVNGDDPASERMLRDCRGRAVRFGFGENADYRALDIATSSSSTHFILRTPDGETEAELRLIGRHNVANALTAAALAGEVFHLSVHQLAMRLKDATGAPGRLQSVRAGQPFAVLVDYAHTDDALRNVLKALRPLTHGKLRVLFGCGGDRDRTKRPRMATVAAELADVVYVTSDNPRTENAQAIIDEILTGIPRGFKDLHVEIDRRAAIEKVLSEAGNDDVVLLAGKGHENYQIVGTEKLPFDDAAEAARVLRSVFAV